MANPQPTVNPIKYYFYEDATRIIYYSDEMLEDQELIYIGSSDNPKPAMAAAAFMQSGKVQQGYRLRER